MRCGSRLQRQRWMLHARVVAGKAGEVRSSVRRRHRRLGGYWGVPSSRPSQRLCHQGASAA